MKPSVKNLVEIAVVELSPYAKNAKKHPEKQIKQIMRSIEQFGFMTPLLIDSEKNLICGHGRLMAAKRLGMKTVPCVIAEHLTKEQRRAFVHVENRLQESGGAEWDVGILKEEIEDLIASVDLDMAGVGFSDDEILALVGKNDDFVPDLSDDDNKIRTIKHRLTIDCEDADQKQELFDELNGRGYKVKGG